MQKMLPTFQAGRSNSVSFKKVILTIIINVIGFSTITFGQQRYLGLSLVNEGNWSDLELIEQAHDVGCNAVFLSIQWGAIEGYISRANKAQYGQGYNVWKMYDEQIAKARSLGMKIGINVAVSSVDNATQSYSDRYGIDTGDGWLRDERILNAGFDGTEAVFQKYGGAINGVHVQFVMTSLAAQSTRDRVSDFARKVAQRYGYLQNTNELLYMDLIYTRQGEAEFEVGTDKYHFEEPTNLRDGNSMADYSQPMQNGYKTWLAAKYEKIQSLNFVWGTNYTSFDQISPKRPSYSMFAQADGADWYLYRTQVLKEINNIFKNTVKSVDSRINVIAHHGSVFDKLSLGRTTFAFNDVAAELDGIKINDDNNYDHRFAIDLLRANLPGKLYINEAGYSPNHGISNFISYATESYLHGAQAVSCMFFENLLRDGGGPAVRELADTWVNQPVATPTPSNQDSFTLSGIIQQNGCVTNRNSYSSDCDAYKTWMNARNTAGGTPVNILLSNDLQKNCQISITGATSASNPTIGSSINLSSSCNGDCSGLGYVWEMNGTQIGNTGTLNNIVVPSKAGRYTYFVTAGANGCAKTSEVVVNVTDPLPVTLIDFKAAARENHVALTWATADEVNSSHFEIQRSANGTSWNAIGTVKAADVSKARLDYDTVDEAPLAGGNLYRLKMVDRDSTFSYSKISSVVFDGVQMAAFYPNPVADRLQLSTTALKNAVSVQLLDQAGKTVLQTAKPSSVISVGHLRAGLYILQITGRDGVVTSKQVAVGR
ncbi:Por secretion system C-terminal sorting domain-containing protein [Dyadobacter soli]|uniref:Por secretion system C-terminal sorting domain-containing protein n=1 Tax=Dyadobacter soli TaxID=659014 RepID=A0A1G7NDV3_9BACT|nr:T9SS type A sorting domain-containing protein [Dyadobacter soli]SDF72214.1 Por secretion system C-terminal sorting domain-containing protein [Dyadobacter soli]